MGEYVVIVCGINGSGIPLSSLRFRTKKAAHEAAEMIADEAGEISFVTVVHDGKVKAKA